MNVYSLLERLLGRFRLLINLMRMIITIVWCLNLQNILLS